MEAKGMETKRRLRTGLIGTGVRGPAYVSTICELADYFEFAGVCDLELARAEATANRIGVKAYSDMARFFLEQALDLVVITTPGATHHLVAKAAAERGINMLMEVPLAPTRAMMDMIEDIATRAGVQVELAENYAFRRPADRLNGQVIQAGLLGDVLRVSSYNAPAGGGHESCHHTMSLLRLYAGSDVAEIQAFSQRNPAKGVPQDGSFASTETWTEALLLFENGVTGWCNYVSSWATPLRWGRPRVVTIDGSDGFIVSDDQGANRLRLLRDGRQNEYALKKESQSAGGKEVPTRYYYETDPAMEFVNPFGTAVTTDVTMTGVADGLARADALMSIYRAVTTGSSPRYGIAQARRDQELSILLTESARLERRIPARLTAETKWEREELEAFRRLWGVDPLKDAEKLARGGMV